MHTSTTTTTTFAPGELTLENLELFEGRPVTLQLAVGRGRRFDGLLIDVDDTESGEVRVWIRTRDGHEQGFGVSMLRSVTVDVTP